MGGTPESRDLRWGDTFLNRFDGKVRGVGRIIHPSSGVEFRVDRRTVVQSFRRVFGQVAQFVLEAGWFKKRRMCLAAISLEEGGLLTGAQGSRPVEDLYRQISSPAGMDFRDDTFYGVGIFSPVGWPDTWKHQAETRSNVHFYLVEKREGTRWGVFGVSSPLRSFFDPELDDEKRARARGALLNHADLLFPGNQVPLEQFLTDFQLERKIVEDIILASDGRWQIINHKGQAVIQRAVV